MQRYNEYTEILKTNDGKRRYSTLYYPKIERRSSDIYIISKSSDRLDLLAYENYGDARYWVILAKVNKLHNATIRIPTGTRLRIPFPLSPSDVDLFFREAQN